MPICKWNINDNGFDFIPIIGESESESAIIARTVTSHMLDKCYFQMCNLENKSGNVLDLVYTNMPELSLVERVEKADLLLIPQSITDKAHVQMVCTIECEPNCFKIDSVLPQIYI